MLTHTFPQVALRFHETILSLTIVSSFSRIISFGQLNYWYCLNVLSTFFITFCTSKFSFSYGVKEIFFGLFILCKCIFLLYRLKQISKILKHRHLLSLALVVSINFTSIRTISILKQILKLAIHLISIADIMEMCFGFPQLREN